MEKKEQIHDLLQSLISKDKNTSILLPEEEAFIIIDVTGQIVYVSKKCESVLGLLNKSQCEQMNQLFDESTLNDKQDYFQGQKREQLNQFHTFIPTLTGFETVNVTSIPVFHEKEYIGAFLVMKKCTEETPNKLMNENKMFHELAKLSEKHAAAGQLAAGIAHEIRNPMTAIKGFLQLMDKENISNKVYIDIVYSEIGRIEGILRELMVLAKPTNQVYEKISLTSLLDQVVLLMESQALLNNIQIVKSYHFNSLWVAGDENQMKQVFINYIKNAIEAMPNGGMLQITGNVVDTSLAQISIIDQGNGIPEHLLKRIGEPFFTTKENGTGLGMLVSQQIIEEHKGSVLVKSSDNGTCITVNVPIVLYELE